MQIQKWATLALILICLWRAAAVLGNMMKQMGHARFSNNNKIFEKYLW